MNGLLCPPKNMINNPVNVQNSMPAQLGGPLYGLLAQRMHSKQYEPREEASHAHHCPLGDTVPRLPQRHTDLGRLQLDYFW